MAGNGFSFPFRSTSFEPFRLAGFGTLLEVEQVAEASQGRSLSLSRCERGSPARWGDYTLGSDRGLDSLCMLVVLMGVAGVGKTTVGELVARELGLPFHDADDFPLR